MTSLTKIDIAALRKGDTLVVRLDKNGGSVRVIKHAQRNERDPFAQDVEHVIPANVTLQGYRGREEIASGAAHCVEVVNFYHSQMTPASCIIKTLRVGDEITFRFYPDAHTNGYTKDAGLHGDVLMLDVRRDGRSVASWELANQICRDNSARMCSGIRDKSDLAA